MGDYEDLKAQVRALVASGALSCIPDREQRIDFAYGNTKLANEAITREMVERACDQLPPR